MNKRYTISLFLLLTIILSANTGYSGNIINYSKTSFIVKMKQDLGVSEATGKISTHTGIRSIDEKNNKYRIKNIKRIFELNNGDAELYKELEMSRIYLFTLDEKNVFDVKEIVRSYSDDENTDYSEPNYLGQAAGKKGRDMGILNQFATTPNDEMMYRQWYINNDGSITPSGRRSAVTRWGRYKYAQSLGNRDRFIRDRSCHT